MQSPSHCEWHCRRDNINTMLSKVCQNDKRGTSVASWRHVFKHEVVPAWIRRRASRINRCVKNVTIRVSGSWGGCPVVESAGVEVSPLHRHVLNRIVGRCIVSSDTPSYEHVLEEWLVAVYIGINSYIKPICIASSSICLCSIGESNSWWHGSSISIASRAICFILCDYQSKER